MLDNKIYDLLCDIENHLIQKIDADENYDKYDSVEHYLMATEPDIYALWKVMTDLFSKKKNK